MLIEINPYNIDQRIISQAVAALKKGQVIIFPTDSVYAMGCDLYNKKGLKKLAELKGEKLKKTQFSIICSDLSEVSKYSAQMDRPTFKVMNKSLPGPFTFILNAASEIPKLFDTNRKEIGIRIPDNKIITEIVRLLGNPIATTSIHDPTDEIKDYYTDPYVIYENFEDKIDIIIDGGHGNLDPSTIVNCVDGIEIVRQGIGELEL